MDYVIAGIAGLALGALCGAAKYFLLWRPMAIGRRDTTAKTIYTAQIISMVANVVILLAVFFLRGFWPYSFEVTIIAAALSLSLVSRLAPRSVMKKLAAQTEAARDSFDDAYDIEADDIKADDIDEEK